MGKFLILAAQLLVAVVCINASPSEGEDLATMSKDSGRLTRDREARHGGYYPVGYGGWVGYYPYYGGYYGYYSPYYVGYYGGYGGGYRGDGHGGGYHHGGYGHGHHG